METLNEEGEFPKAMDDTYMPQSTSEISFTSPVATSSDLHDSSTSVVLKQDSLQQWSEHGSSNLGYQEEKIVVKDTPVFEGISEDVQVPGKVVFPEVPNVQDDQRVVLLDGKITSVQSTPVEQVMQIGKMRSKRCAIFQSSNILNIFYTNFTSHIRLKSNSLRW